MIQWLHPATLPARQWAHIMARVTRVRALHFRGIYLRVVRDLQDGGDRASRQDAGGWHGANPAPGMVPPDEFASRSPLPSPLRWGADGWPLAHYQAFTATELTVLQYWPKVLVDQSERNHGFGTRRRKRDPSAWVQAAASADGLSPEMLAELEGASDSDHASDAEDDDEWEDMPRGRPASPVGRSRLARETAYAEEAAEHYSEETRSDGVSAGSIQASRDRTPNSTPGPGSVGSHPSSSGSNAQTT